MLNRDSGQGTRNDDNLFLQALTHVTTPLEREEPVAVDPLEKEALFKACQIIGSKSNIDFVTSNEIMLTGDNLFEILTNISHASNARFQSALLNGRWWEDDSNHMLAFLKDDFKPVALICEKSRYYLIDPENGQKEEVNEKIARDLHPQAFVFFSVFANEEDYPWKKAIKIMFTGSKREVLYYLLFFLASTLLVLLYPYLNRAFFDYVLPNLDTSLYWQIFLALLIASLTSSLLLAATSTIKLRLTAKITTRLHAVLWSRVMELSPTFFRSMPIGEVLQRVMLIEAFQMELNKNLIRSIFSGILGCLYLIPMIYYSWQLSFIVLAISALAFFIFGAFIPKLFGFNISILRISAMLESALIQIVSGISNIRIFRAEKKAFAHWARIFTKNQKLTLDLGILSNNLRVVSESLSMLVTFLIFGALVLIYQNESGFIGFSLGSFMAFRTAMSSFYGEFSQLVNALIDTQSLAAQWVRIRKVWRGKRKPAFKGAAPELKGNIDVSNLFFMYEKETKPVISDLTLSIKAGEFASVIGPSGCGKSTLLRLLAGIETPLSGTISYDHIPLKDIDPLSFRRQVSVILQTTKVFSGTILDNILCGRKAKKEEIEEAIKLSSFDVSLKQFPLGLFTPLPVGGQLLSNGQRQRLLLARALLTSPKVLLLDEATSAIDTETELAILNRLLNRGMTLCLVTHQPILLKKSDVIFVMENQTIASKGTYEEVFIKYKK